MRVRTEAKRNEILATAASVFLEHGYDAASMSLISQRVGGSKATLYGYFKSKEELLLAAMNFDVSEQIESLMGHLLDTSDLRAGFQRFGMTYLDRRLSFRPTTFFRIVSNRPEESGIGKMFWERTLKVAWMQFCGRLAELMDEGLLRRADPWVCAMHLKGLLESDLVDQRLLGALREGEATGLDAHVAEAVDAFMRIYRAEPKTKARRRRKT